MQRVAANRQPPPIETIEKKIEVKKLRCLTRNVEFGGHLTHLNIYQAC